MVKAIIRIAKIDNCIRQLTRHATPKPFTHLILSGGNGRQFFNHVNTAVAGVFVFGLEDFTSLPALARDVGGGPLHRFARATPMETVEVEEFEAFNTIELYVSGWIEKYANGKDTFKVPYVGLKLTDTTFLDAIDPAFVPFRSDTMEWANVDSRYKLADGSPRIDPDEAKLTTLVRPPVVV